MTQPPLGVFGDGAVNEPVAEAVRRIAIAGFHAHWSGRRVTLAELMAATPALRVAHHLRAQARIESSEDGHVIAVAPTVPPPESSSIEHNGRLVKTRCAVDAIGLRAALAIDVRALTHCPTYGGELGAADP